MSSGISPVFWGDAVVQGVSPCGGAYGSVGLAVPGLTSINPGCMLSLEMGGSRKSYIDIMRIVAMVMVIFCHLEAYGAGLAQGSGCVSGWAHVLQCVLVRVAVPLFFMISGALLLGREESIVQVWKKRVLRMALVILGIWLVQYTYACVAFGTGFGVRTYINAVLGMDNGIGRRADFATSWYLYAYFFLMMMLPLLRVFAKGMSNRQFLYLCILQVAVGGGVPFLYACITGDFVRMPFPLTEPNSVWYGAFFMLMGYFVEVRLPRLESRRCRAVLYVAGAACLLAAGYVLLYCMNPAASHMAKWTASAHLSTIPAIAAYVLVRRTVLLHGPAAPVSKILGYMGQGVFCVMLTENLWRALFKSLGGADDWSLLVDCKAWLCACAVTACGILLGMLLKRVPILRSYL